MNRVAWEKFKEGLGELRRDFRGTVGEHYRKWEFAGTDKRTFLDIKLFKGTLFELLEKSETYLHEHIDWKVEFGGLERKENPEVPVDALREALVNSLCHRDYRNPKGNEVAVFKDRLEIYNPGDFPEGYRPEDFIRGEERSILRNPRIAEVLFKSKDIERWGSGLKRIAEECARQGVNVEFRVLKSGFLVVFHRASPGLLPGSAEETRKKTRKKRGEEIREEILAQIERNARITSAQLAQLLDLPQKSIEWHIRALRKAGRLRRIGSTKAGHWEIDSRAGDGAG